MSVFFGWRFFSDLNAFSMITNAMVIRVGFRASWIANSCPNHSCNATIDCLRSPKASHCKYSRFCDLFLLLYYTNPRWLTHHGSYQQRVENYPHHHPSSRLRTHFQNPNSPRSSNETASNGVSVDLSVASLRKNPPTQYKKNLHTIIDPTSNLQNPPHFQQTHQRPLFLVNVLYPPLR